MLKIMLPSNCIIYLKFIIILEFTSCHEKKDQLECPVSLNSLKNKDLTDLIVDYFTVIDDEYGGTGIATVEVLNKIDTVTNTISITK